MKWFTICLSTGERDVTVEDYIDKYFNGNQAAFARAQGVQPPQVTQWINRGFSVVNDTLYGAPRRELNRS